MSPTITFDTLAFAKKIEASGMEPKQAEAIVEAMKDVFEVDLNDKIFTKEDGKVLKAELKNEIIMWVIGLMVAQSGLILAIIKLFH